MIIETRRLIIRDYNSDDLDDLFRLLSDPTTMSYWPKPFSRDDCRQWIIRNIDLYGEYGFGRRAVELKTNAQIIGDCGVVNREINEIDVNDIGWIIDHEYWNQGYATEAASAMRDYAFQCLLVDAVHANMPWDHTASIRVAEKIGMKKIAEFENIRNRGILTYLYELNRP